MDIKILEVSFVLSCYIGKRYYFIYYFFVFPICGYVIFFDFMCDWYCFVFSSDYVLASPFCFSGLSIVDCPFDIL